MVLKESFFGAAQVYCAWRSERRWLDCHYCEGDCDSRNDRDQLLKDMNSRIETATVVWGAARATQMRFSVSFLATDAR
jgi:hypothetical protein